MGLDNPAPTPFVPGSGVPIVAPRQEHPRKPDGIYERIERLVAGPYCEFSRDSAVSAGMCGQSGIEIRGQ